MVNTILGPNETASVNQTREHIRLSISENRGPVTVAPDQRPVTAAVLASLREMVRQADLAGQRDMPHVAEAKRVIELADPPKPEPKPEHRPVGVSQTGIERGHAVPPRVDVPAPQRPRPPLKP